MKPRTRYWLSVICIGFVGSALKDALPWASYYIGIGVGAAGAIASSFRVLKERGIK